MNLKNILTIDGVQYPNVSIKSLKRSFSILDGENAGRNKEGTMIRDIIGTYYNYALEISPRSLSNVEYDNLYQVISSPSDFHIIKLPYGQTTIEFNAYVSGGEDELFSVRTDANCWRNLTINFIAKSANRKPT